MGFAVLEVSKLLMYSFHYDYIKEKYGQSAELLFTDTDSLVYQIQAEDVYADFYADKARFDFSDYPTDSPFYSSENKKVIGKMKDETAFDPIVEYVGCAPKMYSFITSDHEHHRAKGIQKAVVERYLRHADYLRQIADPTPNTVKTTRIASDHHRLFTVQTNKVGLCSFDNKRWIFDDNIHTLAHGHRTLRGIVVEDEEPEPDHETIAAARLSEENRHFDGLARQMLIDAGVPEEEINALFPI